MGELVFNGLLVLAFAGLAVYSTTIPISGTDYLARYWPMGILIALIVLILIKMVGIVKKLKAENTQWKVDLSFLKSAPIIRLVAAFIWLCLYAWLLPYGGYLLTTFFFCMGVMVLLGSRSVGKIILASFLITIVLFAVFSWGLRVSLPRGYGPLEGISKTLEYLV